MKVFFIFCILAPLNVQLLSIDGRPVDVTPSDILLLIAPLFLLSRKRLALPEYAKSQLRFLFFLISFFIAWCLLSMSLALFEDAGLVVVASAFKFLKPLGLFCLLFWSMGFKPVSTFTVHHFSAAVGICAFTFFFSSFQIPGFPGSQWGKLYLGQLPYGYPNSPMTFLACVLPFSLSGFFSATSRGARFFSLSSALIICSTVVLSLSRSSFVVLVFSALFWMFLSFRRHNLGRIAGRIARISVPVIVLLSLTVIVASLFFDIGYQFERMEQMLEHRVTRTFQSGDTFSGRSVLWAGAVELIMDRPIIGYGFRGISEFLQTHATPHQQYLEIAYKIGIIGLVLFLLLFYRLFKYVRIGMAPADDQQLSVCFFSCFLALAIGNFTQPNFTYSITSNFGAFLAACVLHQANLNFVLSKK